MEMLEKTVPHGGVHITVWPVSGGEFIFLEFLFLEKVTIIKKSRFLAKYKGTHLWKRLFVPQRKEKTKVETFSNSKKTTAGYSSGLDWESLDPDVVTTY